MVMLRLQEEEKLTLAYFFSRSRFIPAREDSLFTSSSYTLRLHCKNFHPRLPGSADGKPVLWLFFYVLAFAESPGVRLT